MILTIGGEKGGSGKTTIAVHIAAIGAAEGKDVLLVDADPQQSAAQWTARRADLHPEATPIRCVSLHGNRIQGEIADLGRRYELVIVDTGGRDSPELRCALVVANRVVLPIRPEQFDCWTLPTMEALVEQVGPMNPGLSVTMALNQIPYQTRDQAFKETQDWIREECPGLPHEMVPLVGRAAFGRANAEGLAVTELPRRDGKACAEIMRLYREVVSHAG